MGRNRGQATDDLIKLAAYHEIGHALLSEAHGLKVYQVVVRRDAGGHSESDLPLSPKKDLQITLAGYVAECIYHDEVPSYSNMKLDISMEDDVDEVSYLACDGRFKRGDPVEEAMEATYIYLTIPSVKRRLRRLAERLSRTRRIDGRIFKR